MNGPIEFPLFLALPAGNPAPWQWALLIPLAVLAGVLPALAALWIRTRQAVQAYYTRPLRLQWLEQPPLPPGEPGEKLDAELQSLGYRPQGFMAPEEGKGTFFRVYIHETLPIYALAALAYDASGVYSAVPQLESFLGQGGRLSTTVSRDFGRLTAAAPAPQPRLVQLRAWGPGTATALDGQHVGTLKAWLSGKREFLPATREALIPYLTADHEWLRETLARAPWISFPYFLRAQFGTPKGVLKF